MTSFRSFLDALDTPGGNLFILLLACVGFIVLLTNGNVGIADFAKTQFLIAYGAVLGIINSKRQQTTNANAGSTVQVNSNPTQPTQENKP